MFLSPFVMAILEQWNLSFEFVFRELDDALWVQYEFYFRWKGDSIIRDDILKRSLLDGPDDLHVRCVPMNLMMIHSSQFLKKDLSKETPHMMTMKPNANEPLYLIPTRFHADSWLRWIPSRQSGPA